MQRGSHGTAAIMIPTGRNGCCYVVPSALVLALEADAVSAGLLARCLVQRVAAHAAGSGRED